MSGRVLVHWSGIGASTPSHADIAASVMAGGDKKPHDLAASALPRTLVSCQTWRCIVSVSVLFFSTLYFHK